jgi:hypothetical protein
MINIEFLRQNRKPLLVGLCALAGGVIGGIGGVVQGAKMSWEWFIENVNTNESILAAAGGNRANLSEPNRATIDANYEARLNYNGIKNSLALGLAGFTIGAGVFGLAAARAIPD